MNSNRQSASIRSGNFLSSRERTELADQVGVGYRCWTSLIGIFRLADPGSDTEMEGKCQICIATKLSADLCGPGYISTL